MRARLWARRSVRVSLVRAYVRVYDRLGGLDMRALAAFGQCRATLAYLRHCECVAGPLRGWNGPLRMAYASAGRERAASVSLAYAGCIHWPMRGLTLSLLACLLRYPLESVPILHISRVLIAHRPAPPLSTRLHLRPY